MRPKAPRVGDKGETSVNSCGPRHPEWETRGDKCKLHAAQGTQGGDKCELMRPKAPRVGDKGETSANSCGPRNPEWGTSVGDKCRRQAGGKCKLMQPKAPRVGDKGETSVNSCGPRNPEWETSVVDKCGRQVGDKCKLMRPKAPRVRDKCVRPHWETRGGLGDKGETSVNSCGPRHPEWETRGDKCKLMRPKARRVGDKAAQGTQSGRHVFRRQMWETSGRQV